MSIKVYALQDCPFSIAATNLLRQINSSIEVIPVLRSEKDMIKKLVDHPTFPCIQLNINNNIINIGGNDTLELLVKNSSELKEVCSSDTNKFKQILAKTSINTNLSKRVICNFYKALYTN